MPRAGHDAFLIQIAGAERSSHVRAKVVDGVILAAAVEHGHQPVADVKRGAGAFRDSADRCDGDDLRQGAGLDIRG